MLGRVRSTEYGIAYSPRGPRQRSRHSSQRMGKPFTGPRAAGNSIEKNREVLEMRDAETVLAIKFLES